MFKKLLIICVLVIGTLIYSHAQTLKITDVSSRDDRMYKQVSENALGKNILLQIFDSSVKVTLPGEKPIILKQTSENHYYAVTEERDKEVWSASLEINTTLGVTTSANLTITVTGKGSDFAFNRHSSCTLTAKRF